MTSLDELIPAGETILVDSSVVVAYLDGTEDGSARAATLLDGFVRRGRNEAVISTVTLSEVLVRPFASGQDRRVFDVLLAFPNLVVRAVDPLVAAEAARFRAARRMRGADALILATAALASAGVFVTADRELADAARVLVPGMLTVRLAESA